MRKIGLKKMTKLLKISSFRKTNSTIQAVVNRFHFASNVLFMLQIRLNGRGFIFKSNIFLDNGQNSNEQKK